MVAFQTRRTARFIFAIVFLAAALAVPFARANACTKSFRIYNDTDTAIEQLYVAPSESRTWEDDVLGDNVLDSGSNTVIDMSADTRDFKLYDVKAVFSNGAVITGGKIPICSAVHVHVHASGVTYTT
jgi:hypothetical protein